MGAAPRRDERRRSRRGAAPTKILRPDRQTLNAPNRRVTTSSAWGDNSWTTTARFLVAPAEAMPDGAHTIGIDANSRAFNPSGSDDGPSSNWSYDPLYSWTRPRRHIAIVTEGA